MTSEEYEKYALVFNPTEYDPAEWVSLAKKRRYEIYLLHNEAP